MNYTMRQIDRIFRQGGFAELLRRLALYNIKAANLLWGAVIRRYPARDIGLDALVDYAFRRAFRSMEPVQIKSEIRGLLKIVERIRPRSILEIGTSQGGTLFLFCRIASDDATVATVDLPPCASGLGYSRWRIPIYRSFALPRQKVRLVQSDSQKASTLEMVKDIFKGGPVDFLFIDGDHRYESVKRDFELYAPLVRKGGIIAFHDIVKCLLTDQCNVHALWEELKKRYRHKEIIEDKDQTACGIGVLYVE